MYVNNYSLQSQSICVIHVLIICITDLPYIIANIRDSYTVRPRLSDTQLSDISVIRPILQGTKLFALNLHSVNRHFLSDSDAKYRIPKQFFGQFSVQLSDTIHIVCCICILCWLKFRIIFYNYIKLSKIV